MKAFQKIIYLSIFLFLIISTWSLLTEKPFFYQFNLDGYGFLAITKFIVPALVYVCIHEKLLANKKIDIIEVIASNQIDIKKIIAAFKPYYICFGLLIVISLMTLFAAKFFGGARAEFLDIFYPPSYVNYYIFILCAISIHKNTIPIPLLRLNEKPIYYFKLFLISIIGVCVFLLVIYALATLQFHKKLNGTATQFIIDCIWYATLTVSLSFFISFGLNKISLLRKSILFPLIITTIAVFSLIKYIGYPQEYFRVLITENVLLMITFFPCLIMVSNPIGRSKRILKINKLTSNLSKKEAEYLQLKNQINPHFLFNNLNVLVSFIELDPKKAIEFGHHLSNVYRHYLKNQTEDYVSLEGEINFITEYLSIYKAKFEKGFSFKMPELIEANQYILPNCLQELIDNIFKHNIIAEEIPLEIEIFIENNTLVIQNTINKKEVEIESNFGLENINKRYLLLTNTAIQINESPTHFSVKIPILELEA